MPYDVYKGDYMAEFKLIAYEKRKWRSSSRAIFGFC